MKSLIVAFVSVLVGSVILFGILSAFGVGDKTAGPIASSFLGAITWVHDKVEKKLQTGASTLSMGVVPVDGFSIRWPYMLAYATLIMLAIFEMGSYAALGPARFLVTVANGTNTNAPHESRMTLELVFTTILALPCICFGIFLLGRWAGIRSGRAGFWIMPVSILLGRIAEVLAIGLFAHATWAWTVANFRTVTFVGAFIVLAVFIGTGTVGVWLGNRIRLGAYLNYLLKQVPDGTRQSIVAIAFEEANRKPLASAQSV